MKARERKYRLVRILVTALLLVSLGIAAYFSFNNLRFEESIASILPADKENQFLVEILDSADFFDRIVFHVKLTDTTNQNPNLLVDAAKQLSDSIEKKFIPDYIQKIEGKVDPTLQYKLMENFYTYLPYYLETEDYAQIDSMIEFGNFDNLLGEHLKRLNSPAGMVMARFIFRDPLGLAANQMKRLRDLQLDKNLRVYKDFLLTEDNKNLLFFLTPVDAANTGTGEDFINALDENITQIETHFNEEVQISYIGSLPVANANALQIKRDVQLTVSVAILVIAILIFYFFRRKRILLIIFLPALLGAFISIVVLGLVQESISMIALGIGAVLLGISVDYALHLVTHFKHEGNIRQSKYKLALPIMMSSLTTAAAFLCLLVLSSPAMRQLGLFAAISVVSAAAISIVFLPWLIPEKLIAGSKSKTTIFDKLAAYEIKNKMWPILILLVITIVLGAFSKKAHFEKDIEKSNFMPDKLQAAQDELSKVSSLHQKKLYLLSQGMDLDEALRNLEKQKNVLFKLHSQGETGSYFGVYSLVFSSSYQKQKIEDWESFWTQERKNRLQQKLFTASQRNHFKPEAFSSFYDLLDKQFEITPPEKLFADFSTLIKDFKIPLSDRTLIATIVNIYNEEQKVALQKAFNKDESAFVLDRKDFFLRIFETIQLDFDKLIKISLAIVFLIILLFFGRIELAVITFIPIVLSWIWTLGFMGITGLSLNYFNIIICSLIFGLGVDYSIFITKGLVRRYKSGSKDLQSFRASILISVVTTITGLGVLILAKHPALKSIAVLSIVGIVSVVIISFTLQSILFRLLIENKNGKRLYPYTLIRFLITVIIFGSFAIIAILLTACIPFVLVLPLRMSKKRYLMRYMICMFIRGLVLLYPPLRIEWKNFNSKDFSHASIIVSNHQSMIDILIFLSLSPNILMLTKGWVWNSPIFGLLIRFSGYLYISKGYGNMQEIVQKRINDGCSILSFPEGSRTKNGSIRRYHKGAFHLAEQLDLPVQVFLVHGAWEAFPRNTLLLTPGHISVSKLYETKLDKADERASYHATKKICADSRMALRNFYSEEENPQFFRCQLIGNYMYKGPVLEHYMRIKLRMEKNYQVFHSLIPLDAFITDIGCGYGAMDFMLCLKSDSRRVVGIDYDKEKIDTAQNSALAQKCKASFKVADAMEAELEESDVFLISDTLHYLPENKKKLLIGRCLGKLKPGGKIIIRDSATELTKRHRGTQLSEFLSTGIGFNKTQYDLSFVSHKFIAEVAQNNDLRLETVDKTSFNSNIIYILFSK